MAFCTECGNELEDATFCTNCGAKNETSSHEYRTKDLDKAQSQAVSPELLIPSAETLRAPSVGTGKRKVLIGIGLAVGLVIVLFVVASVTAKHWVKVDIPEHAETFHTETYLTGNFNVVDDKVSPCWVGQYWYDCINIYVSEYNGTCANFPLTASATSYCELYSNMIDEMKSRGNSRSYVSSLGSWGHLSAVAEEATQQVSNNDYRPAVTHEAVCYLGFIGECETS